MMKKEDETTRPDGIEAMLGEPRDNSRIDIMARRVHTLIGFVEEQRSLVQSAMDELFGESETSGVESKQDTVSEPGTIGHLAGRLDQMEDAINRLAAQVERLRDSGLVA